MVWILAAIVFNRDDGRRHATRAPSVSPTTAAGGEAEAGVGPVVVDTRRTAALRADSAVLTAEGSLAIARAYVGRSVLEAVPFTLPGDSLRRIAVLREYDPELDGEGSFGVVLLSGARGSYSQRAVPLFAEGPAPVGERLFGVADADGDGAPEVYVVSRDMGATEYVVTVKLYSPTAGSAWQVDVRGDYAVDRRYYTWSGEYDARPRYREWLRERARSVAEELETSERADTPDWRRYRAAVTDWYAQNGEDFHRGAPKGDVYGGRPPRSPTPHCRLYDGDVTWYAHVAGPVWAYRDDSHRMVFMPPNANEWVTTLVSGKRYLWMNAEATGDDGGTGLVAYDKRTGTLEVVHVPELSGAKADCGDTVCRGEPLAVADGHLLRGGRRVSPVVDADEFTNAATCPGPGL
ncbi:MAG TPA: hypothetical protein VFQ39_02215 [Longimicrobium sp.]|nr:hypothetical protein [Longimicrobium sp.]